MLPLTYFLKVILCSAIFFVYYLIGLRNRKINQFNRFYLLFSVIASLLIPNLNFEISTGQAIQQPVYRALTFISESSSDFEAEPIQEARFSIDWMQILAASYYSIAFVLFIKLLNSIVRIFRITKKYNKHRVDNILLINTTENGTPFSFFNVIFWNSEIDINSEEGKHIYQHELTHVKERHSWDKIFISLIIVFGWFNPFYWLIKRELEMIHEFIADKRAITNSNAADLASMLLVSSFPTTKYSLANSFYHSPIKRRLNMITKSKLPEFSNLRKFIALPLLLIVFFLFAFRQKEVFTGTSLLNKYKVVIDAGHGGKDSGCHSADVAVNEKDINLAIVRAIKRLCTNENIEIVLTRDNDQFDDLRAKADFINNQKADLCVSIHCGNAGQDHEVNGTEIYIANLGNYNGLMSESHDLAQSVNGVLKTKFANRGINTKKQEIFILQAAECPIILVEAGFLSNEKDAALLSDFKKQEEFAGSIIAGIENYLALKEER